MIQSSKHWSTHYLSTPLFKSFTAVRVVEQFKLLDFILEFEDHQSRLSARRKALLLAVIKLFTCIMKPISFESALWQRWIVSFEGESETTTFMLKILKLISYGLTTLLYCSEGQLTAEKLG